MLRKLIYVNFCMLAIVSVSAHAALIHHWKLDEDTATGDTIAVDSVGGLNGTIQGAISVEGILGNALSFDGEDDLVEIAGFRAPPKGTIVFWINTSLTQTVDHQRVMGSSGNYETWISDTGAVYNEFSDGGGPRCLSRAQSSPMSGRT